VDDYLLHKFIQQGRGKLGKLGVPLHQFDKLVSPHAVGVVAVDFGL